MELPFKQGLWQRASLCSVTNGAKLLTQSLVERDSTWTGYLGSVFHCHAEPPKVTSSETLLERDEEEGTLTEFTV